MVWIPAHSSVVCCLVFVQTIDSLVAASNMPLSVVIVGVGQANFSVSVPFMCFFIKELFATYCEQSIYNV